MKRYGCLLFLILLCAFSATAQVFDRSTVDKEEPKLGWISLGLGAADSLFGFNVNACILVSKHCFSAQYVQAKEILFLNFSDKPENSRYEFNLTYGRKTSTNSVIALGSIGACYMNERIYEVVGSYNDDPDDWFGFGTEYIWAARQRSYYGIIAKGQILLRTKTLGIGPSIAVSFTGERTFLSIYLDVAFGNLK
ncbi:MAG: hypothetical protein Q7U71_02895 [bacterium]|nr:hypothetical protein [bacterium]